jgi:arginase family enzyme
VLDESVFSAQGLPVPDGLSKEEFQSTLKVLVKSGKLCALSLMVFDAAKDADGNQAKRIVELVSEALK